MERARAFIGGASGVKGGDVDVAVPSVLRPSSFAHGSVLLSTQRFGQRAAKVKPR
jgi:hypothetical protein